MEREVSRFAKAYPWYASLTGDLLFYIAISTLFLTVTKGFSAAEIVSADSIATTVGIVFQFPVLRVIQRIGNTASSRVSATLLLSSAVLLTIAPNYAVMLIGRIFYTLSFIFQSVSVVALENNLDLIDRRADFVSIRLRAKTLYAIFTMLIAFVASPLFNFNQYLPMIGCITTCSIGFVLSFFMVDYSPYNKIRKTKNDQPVKLRFTKFLLLCVAAYGLFYTTANTGQTEGTLFVQETLFESFDVETTTLILGGIISVSRIVRVLSNLVFGPLYKRYAKYTGVALSSLLCLAIACLLFGSFFTPVWLKIAIMGFGYVIILFIRDPFVIFIHDIVFNNTPKEHHQTLLTILAFATKTTKAVMGFAFTLILLDYSLTVVMAMIFGIGILQLLVSIALYKTDPAMNA